MDLTEKIISPASISLQSFYSIITIILEKLHICLFVYSPASSYYSLVWLLVDACFQVQQIFQKKLSHQHRVTTPWPGSPSSSHCCFCVFTFAALWQLTIGFYWSFFENLTIWAWCLTIWQFDYLTIWLWWLFLCTHCSLTIYKHLTHYSWAIFVFSNLTIDVCLENWC